MIDSSQADRAQAGEAFAWHPVYKGQTPASVQSSLSTEIASDQRAYALTLEGAAEHEGDSLSSIIALDRKWCPFDLNWAETKPNELAARIVAFEQERDRRNEHISYAEYRDSTFISEVAEYPDPSASQRLESPLARGVVVLVVILLLVGLWFFVFR